MTARFSFSRLGRLIAKQFFENARLYLFSFLALFGLLSIVFAFWMLSSDSWSEIETWIIFLFGLFISGTIFSSMTFSMLGSKSKGLYWLTIPATHLEKLLCAIFYSTIFFTVLYGVCFFLVKMIGVAILEQYVKSHPGTVYNKMTDFKSGFGAVIKYFMYTFLGVQSLYLLGSVYFSRYSFILTSIVAAFFVFLFMYYTLALNRNMFDSGGWNLLFLRRFVPEVKDGYLLYSFPAVIENIMKYVMIFMWAPVFWVVTWFRLKEKEI